MTFLSDWVVIVTAGCSMHLTYVAQCRCNDQPVHCLYCTPLGDDIDWLGSVLAVQGRVWNSNQPCTSPLCRSIQDFVRFAIVACVGPAFQTTLLPSLYPAASIPLELAIRQQVIATCCCIAKQGCCCIAKQGCCLCLVGPASSVRKQKLE